MALRITDVQKDLPLLNRHFGKHERLAREVRALQKQINALLQRLKDANIP